MRDSENLGPWKAKVAEELRDMGREISEIKGFLAATKISFDEKDTVKTLRRVELIQDKVDAVKNRIQSETRKLPPK
ncbi:MAG: hypothetical protein ACRBBQ_15865 [Cognatishimia sp.]